jgi:DNA-binding response OmpR family regulator
MLARLVARGGERAGDVYPLSSGVISVGRGADNDVNLSSPHVSRRHAELRWDADSYVLHDTDSKNGVFVNGRRLTEPHTLASGDVIAIAGRPDLVLIFESDDETVTVQSSGTAAGPIVVDPRTAEVHVRGEPVELRPKEYTGLALLYEKGGALVTKEELAQRVWPEFDGVVSDDSIEQIIYRLRRKLEESPEQPRHLLTVRGRGYRLVNV